MQVDRRGLPMRSALSLGLLPHPQLSHRMWLTGGDVFKGQLTRPSSLISGKAELQTTMNTVHRTTTITHRGDTGTALHSSYM